jgi:hypothetical protein
VTRPGGVVSAVACFCHHDGLPEYHGRYPFPGDQRINELDHKLWRVWREHVRPGLLGVDHSIPSLELVWQFSAAGLEDVQVNGHLKLVSPGDARIPVEEASAYALLQHQKWLERLAHRRKEHGAQLAQHGFSEAEFDELVSLERARYEYLQGAASRVREVMEVFVQPLFFVRGTRRAPGP